MRKIQKLRKDLRKLTITQLKEKKRQRKTKRMQKENFQTDVKKKHKKMKIRLIGLGGGKTHLEPPNLPIKDQNQPSGFGGSLRSRPGK